MNALRAAPPSDPYKTARQEPSPPELHRSVAQLFSAMRMTFKVAGTFQVPFAELGKLVFRPRDSERLLDPRLKALWVVGR